MRYERGGYEYKGLWIGEGFLSQDDMDTWFRDVVKKGETLMQYMMCFSLIK
jgi:hypothetical protein